MYFLSKFVKCSLTVSFMQSTLLVTSLNKSNYRTKWRMASVICPSIFFYFILLSFATRAGSPQQREPISVDLYYLTHLSTFPVGGNRSTRRKPTTFGRALTILFLHEDWVRVHIKMNLTGDRTRNLRGEKQVV